MLGQCHEMLAHQRASPRWKEWIPLVTQQLRLRNLIQVIAYNVNTPEKLKCDAKPKSTKVEKIKSSFYYTLHLTTMSAPFYTSEKLENENPKWAEIEISDAVNSINASVNGIVVRLWVHRKQEQDQVVTVWGVYFSGLVYLGPRLCSDPAAFCLNTIVFHMQGGYFTAPQCFKETAPRLRHTQVKINTADVRPSYTVSLVSRLHTIQQAIKKQRSAAQALREKISVGGYSAPESRESATLRRLLNKSRPQAPQRQELLKLQREVEMAKFRVELLTQERARKLAQLQNLEKARNCLYEQNQDRGTDLMNNYQILHKDMERLKVKRKNYIDTRDAYLITNAQLIFRQKQLISKLNQIYPVEQMPNGKYSICGVHLPDAEEFAGHDDIMIAVSLGYVAHALQMISIFLQVPLRYPIIHFGSWSRIVDHVVEKIPEKDREFPLFSRGKEKLQFCYGVYLLNKNIAQLRWYCGLPTQDLRLTLCNLGGLLHIQPANTLEHHHHHQRHYHYQASSGSSADLRSSSQAQSPVGSTPVPDKSMGHRVCRSMDGSEMNFQTKQDEPDVQSAKDFHTSTKRTDLVNGTPSVTASLSYSLDKGLDEYEEMKRAERPSKALLHTKPQAHVCSEPILTQELRDKVRGSGDLDGMSSGDEAKKRFLQTWQARGPAPVCSDEDLEALLPAQSPAPCPASQDDTPANGTQIAEAPENNGMLSYKEEEEIQNAGEKEGTESVEQALHQRNGETVSNSSLDMTRTASSGSCSPNNIDNFEVKSDLVVLSQSECETGRKQSLCEGTQMCSGGGSEDEACVGRGTPELFDEASCLEEMSQLIGHSTLVDSVFASVASRTEALASRSGSFNLVRSRHSSVLEDGNL